MEKVVLFGNGSIAKAAYYRLVHDSPYEVAAFTVDKEYITEDKLFDLSVVPFTDIESIYPPDEYKMLIAAGYVKVNRLRAERYYQAKAMGYQLISHVSSKALVSPKIAMGENCLISANAMISSSVEIGENIIIGAGCFIGHDTIIKDHCFIGNCVAIGGGVTIEPYCFLGLNSTIRNKIVIARECVIGAGTVILKDTKDREVYMARSADLLPISSDKLSLS